MTCKRIYFDEFDLFSIPLIPNTAYIVYEERIYIYCVYSILGTNVNSPLFKEMMRALERWRGE